MFVVITAVNNTRERMYELSSPLLQRVIPQSTGKVGGEGKSAHLQRKERGKGRNALQKLVGSRAGLTSVGGRIHSGPAQEGIERDSGQA